MELNYEDTSSVKDADNNEVNTGSHQDFFEPLNEETYVEDTETEEEAEEVTDEKKLEESVEIVEEEKIEKVAEVVEEEEIEELAEVSELESEVIEAEEVEEMEEVVEDEEISVESEDEVVEVNDEFPSSASGLETDMTPTSDDSVEPPSLDMEEDHEVDTELDEYGNVVEVFAVKSRSVDPRTLTDTRLDGVKGAAGTVSHFGETKGGVSFTIDSGKSTVEGKRYKFQGTARPSLVFTGGILNSKAQFSAIETFSNGVIKLHNTTTTEGTLRDLLINAANERIDEINGVKYPDDKLISSIDDRTYLVLALSAILSANNGNTSNSALSLTFRDLDSLIPRQVTLDFKDTVIFTTALDFVKI